MARCMLYPMSIPRTWLGVTVGLKSAVATDVIASLPGLSWFQILITCSMLEVVKGLGTKLI